MGCKVDSVKRVAMLLIWVLFFGQVHLCQAAYELPNGQKCAVCPQLTDPTESEPHFEAKAVKSSHGDCHDCCELDSCEDHGQAEQSKSQASFEFIDVPLPLGQIQFQRFHVNRSRPVYVASAPATGPPSPHSSRAPPENTNRIRPLDARSCTL